MTREQALSLVRQYVKNENSIKHMLATEAIMRKLACLLGENEDSWGLAGLLHDLDMEIVDYRSNPEKQGAVGADMLETMGLDKTITNAIRAHNEATGKTRDNLIEKAIYAVDPLTGLIVAATLILTSKKLSDVSPESVLRRFKEKSFAKGARREAIAACSEIGLNLERFVQVGLEAMQEISEQLGL
jgi:putative nucleotidyltransferase with HDIG domain